MDITELRGVLKRAATLFGASGAKAQASALNDVEKLLADSGDATVEQFVERTSAALDRPPLAGQTVEEVLAQLYEVGGKRHEADRLLSELKGKAFTNESLATLASRFTGLPVKSVATKAKAVKAIKNKLDERAYLESKERMNAGVTPW